MSTTPELTENEKRVKIAEACGWTKCKLNPDPTLSPRGFSTLGEGPDYLPDYFTDLNAMHEAEMTFTGFDEQMRYCELLWKDDLRVGDKYEMTFACATSTARQRAEAFGRTLGLW